MTDTMSQAQPHDVGIERLRTISGEQLVHVEAISPDEYVLFHTDDFETMYGGKVTEDGLEKHQVMVGDQAVRFDPETLETEFVQTG